MEDFRDLNIDEARVYVGTYGKYNEGDLSGAWLDLSDYEDKDEFFEACEKLHYEEDEDGFEIEHEFMFQDWENIPEGLIGESWISGEFFEWRNALRDADFDDEKEEAFWIFVDGERFAGDKRDADDFVREFEDRYQGHFRNAADFAYEFHLQTTGDADKLHHWPYNCIDWNDAARELKYDYTFHDDGRGGVYVTSDY